MVSLRQFRAIPLSLIALGLLTACTLMVAQRDELALPAQPLSELPTPEIENELTLPAQPLSELPTSEIEDDPAIRAIFNEAWTKLVQPSQSYRMTITVTSSEAVTVSQTLFFTVVDQEHMYFKQGDSPGEYGLKGYECIQVGDDSYVNLGTGWWLAQARGIGGSRVGRSYAIYSDPCNNMLSFFLVAPYDVPAYGSGVHPIFKSLKFEHPVRDSRTNAIYDVYQIWQLTDGEHVSCTTRVWIHAESGLLERIDYIASSWQCFYPRNFTRVIEYDESIKIEKPTLDGPSLGCC